MRAAFTRDVALFARFLVRCVEGGGGGVERAVAVTVWWRVLLRRHFAAWEHAGEEENPFWDGDGAEVAASKEEEVGRAWWRAFREVKGQMDEVVRRRFGGCFALK